MQNVAACTDMVENIKAIVSESATVVELRGRCLSMLSAMASDLKRPEGSDSASSTVDNVLEVYRAVNAVAYTYHNLSDLSNEFNKEAEAYVTEVFKSKFGTIAVCNVETLKKNSAAQSNLKFIQDIYGKHGIPPTCDLQLKAMFNDYAFTEDKPGSIKGSLLKLSTLGFAVMTSGYMDVGEDTQTDILWHESDFAKKVPDVLVKLTDSARTFTSELEDVKRCLDFIQPLCQCLQMDNMAKSECRSQSVLINCFDLLSIGVRVCVCVCVCVRVSGASDFKLSSQGLRGMTRTCFSAWHP